MDEVLKADEIYGLEGKPSLLIVTASSRLDDLTSPPLWRGCIDFLNDMTLGGWAIDLENFAQTLELEVFVCGVPVAKTTTRLRRKDVSRKLKSPSECGFRISLSGVSTDAAAIILQKLKALGDIDTPASKIMSVRLAKTDVILPFSSRLRREMISTSKLYEIFDSAIALTSKNQYIQTRDSILDATDSNPTYDSDVSVIAYYLPQFHPFPENNEWWGTGFTEWTNVVTAKQYFPGHYQPHIPADLGYYDLRIPEVHKSQIELAKKYGISGFCYYYYWFSGTILMSMPIDRHLDENYDFSFCLCWANENWSRRWDGSEADLLMAQRHTEEDDVAFITSCLKYFRSPKYITIDGKPLIQVYRVSLLENPVETVERWRRVVLDHGFPGLHVSMVETFGLSNPSDFGCDSSSQFPPHGVVAANIRDEVMGADRSCSGNFYSYEEVVRSEVARPPSPHLQFRGAMPSWDNTSRKGAAGNIFLGSSPPLFESWLSHLVQHSRRTLPDGSRLIFINAWNEWAEGAHLEPDRKFGHRNLLAVRNSLMPRAKILSALESAPDDLLIEGTSVGEVRAFVQKLLISNEHLGSSLKPLYGKYGWHINWSSQFVDVDASLLKVRSAAAGSRAWVETLNGRAALNTRLATLSTRQSLVVRGWVQLMDKTPMWDTVPFFLLLTDSTSRSQLMATVYDREARSDVIETLSIPKEALWCGFSVTAELANVPAGRYALDVLVGDTAALDRGIAVPSNITLIVG